MKKGPVFRVTGLPACQPDDNLKAALAATIEDELSDEEKAKLKVRVTVVPSCYDDKKRCALVDFSNGVPAFLSALEEDPLGDWQTETSHGDISFDKHFFGFTQLYTPTNGMPITAE